MAFSNIHHATPNHTRQQQCCSPNQLRHQARSATRRLRPLSRGCRGWELFPSHGIPGKGQPWIPPGIRTSAPLQAGCRRGVRCFSCPAGGSRSGQCFFRRFNRWSARLQAGCPRGHRGIFQSPGTPRKGQRGVPFKIRTSVPLLAGCRRGVRSLFMGVAGFFPQWFFSRDSNRWSAPFQVCVARGHRIFPTQRRRPG